MMVKRTIVLPLDDNEGLPLARQIDQAEAVILGLAGGYSRHDSSGVWLDVGGDRYSDRSITLTVVSTDQVDAAIVAALPGLAALLRQRSLYSDATAVTVAFVAPAAVTAAQAS